MDDLGVDRSPEASPCLYRCAVVTLLNKNVNNRAMVDRRIICESTANLECSSSGMLSALEIQSC